MKGFWKGTQLKLIKAEPRIEPLVVALGPISAPELSSEMLPEAVAKIVIGQMLSGKAASSIYQKMESARDSEGYSTTCELPFDTLRAIGVSRRKIRTIVEFITKYNEDVEAYQCWKEYDFNELSDAVQSHWGMSTWSAQMLGIFYFGHSDIRPHSDGTITRAETYLREKLGITDIEKLWCSSKPCRTYFALMLWKAVDTNYFSDL